MRVFVALNLDEETKRGIGGLSGALKAKCAGGRFVDPVNYHITLEFIGEIDPSELTEIRSAMDEVAAKSRPFDIGISELGRFERKKDSILWIGVDLGRFALAELHNKLKQSLDKGKPGTADPSFNPHVTLGRRVVFKGTFEQLRSESAIGSWPVRVDRLVLMESARIGGKLMYTPIYESRFSHEANDGR